MRPEPVPGFRATPRTEPVPNASFAPGTGPGSVPIPDLEEGTVRAEPAHGPSRVLVGPADLDSDGDGAADTVAAAEEGDLTLYTDLDGDGLADQVLRLGSRHGPPPAADPPACPDPVDPGPGGDHPAHWWAPWTWFG